MSERDLGKRLSIARQYRGISQRVFAERIHISVKHLNQLEKGAVSLWNLRVRTLVLMEQELRVTMHYLLGLSDESDIDISEAAALALA